MLQTILSSYKTYLKNFPVILLFAVPLLVLSGIEIYFEGLTSANRGVKYFISLALFILPLISAATDIAVYQRLFKSPRVNPFGSLKTLFVYLFVQLGLGLIAILPIIIFRALFLTFMSAGYAMTAALFVNMFVGIYFLARFNIILPLIVREQTPNLKEFLAYTDDSYRKWLAVSFLVYLPYIVLNYVIPCPYLHMAVTNLFMLVFVSFNAVYVMERKTPAMKPVLVKEAETAKAKTAAAPQEAPKVKKPAVKKPAKPAPKAPKPETKKEPKKKIEKPKKPVLKPVEA